MAQAIQKKQPSATDLLVRRIESPELKSQLTRALPEHMPIERFARICITVLRDRPDLERCDRLSVIGAIVESAQLGLELDPVLGHGYLVPFKGKCIFIAGYRGLIHLMRNSGEVTQVNAEIVCQTDTFSVDLGSDRRLIHKPEWECDRTDPKNWIGAYSVVKGREGWTDFEYMTRAEIERIHQRSPARDAGPWATDTAEMWKKTTVRRIAKRMPLSPRLRTLIEASIRDEYRDVKSYVESEPMAPALQAETDEEPDAPAPFGIQPTERRTIPEQPQPQPQHATQIVPPVQLPAPKATPSGAGAQGRMPLDPSEARGVVSQVLITAGQNKHLWALARNAGMDEKMLHELLETFGIAHVAEIPASDYDRVCQAVETFTAGEV